MNGPGHSMAIVRELHARWPRLTFDATIKVEHILERRALLGELAHSGCLFIVSAVESLSDRVLAVLDKGHSRADVYEAVRLTREARIALRPTFVAFTPWTAAGDYLELFELCERADLWDAIDPVQFTIRLLVPPGSALLDEPGGWLGPLAPDGLSFTWAHPDPRMDVLQREATELVAEASEREEEARATIQRLRALAGEMLGGMSEPRATLFLGQGPPTQDLRPTRARKRIPRLTEPWFC